MHSLFSVFVSFLDLNLFLDPVFLGHIFQPCLLSVRLVIYDNL